MEAEARGVATGEALLARLEAFRGRQAEPARARDPVNQPMIRHWCDALGDANPIYTDPEAAARSRHGRIVAPPTMLQAWIMPGLAPNRAGRAPGPQAEIFDLLDAAGFTAIVATNCEQSYRRYLVLGDLVEVTASIESVSAEKTTALGSGHFVTLLMRYRDARGEEVADMRFRMLKFWPRAEIAAPPPPAALTERPRPGQTRDTAFFWEGVARRELRVQRCTGCGRLRHPPGPACPACHSLAWDHVEASGRGTLYSWVVAHHPPIPPFAYPNVIALVELEEGTRVVANLLGVEPATLRVGMPVRAVFEELEKGRLFLQFRPEGAAESPAAAGAAGREAREAPGPAAAPAPSPEEDAAGGETLPPLELPITPTLIVAGALASRDYEPVHHDVEIAHERGSPDIFMNILTTNGIVGRFVTDWAGPDALLRSVDIRLGAPNFPGDRMRLTGRVLSEEDGVSVVEVVGRNRFGEHVRGRVALERSR